MPSSKESQISQIFVDDPHGGFQENHLIGTEETLHLLVVYPCSDEGWLLEATHWNKSDPDRAQKQKLYSAIPYLFVNVYW